MREIKFQFLYKGAAFSPNNNGFNWHKKTYTLDQLIEKPLRELADVHESSELVAKRQFTGLKDKNGVEIFEDDLVNIFHTSSNGEFNHDCIYRARIDSAYGITFEFESLLWVDHGYNQYPTSTTLNNEYERQIGIEYNHELDRPMLAVLDTTSVNLLNRNKWKANDKSFYFEVIGNIHENPELLA